jgi:cystathionine beta-lyase
MDVLLGSCDLKALRRRRSFKWRTYPADVLPAFVAEMDFDVSGAIGDAIGAAVGIGDLGYAKPIGMAEAFSCWSDARYGWSPDPGNVFAVPDVMTAIAEVVMAVTEPGAGVVINPPVYPPFFFRMGFVGRRVVEAPMARAADGSYELDFAALDEALGGEGVGAYLLCSPHNPVGRVWKAPDLEQALSLCERHGVVMLVDEIHSPLVLEGARHVPIGSLAGGADVRVFTFTSASKGWNIPGLKCGIAVAGSAADAALLDSRWEALLPGHLGVLATTAAFEDGGTWLDAVVAQLSENRVLVEALLSQQLPQVRYLPPEASFLAWLDCRALDLGDDPSAAFLEYGKVALTPGPHFGDQGRGYARLNMGTSPEILAEAVRRMVAAVGRVKGAGE